MTKRCEWHPFDNIRTCVVSRPPLVLFSGCLLMVAAAFVYGGLYINTHPIENPDVSWDWNRMLTNIGRLSFCIQEPAASPSPQKLPQKMSDLYWLEHSGAHLSSTSYSSHSAMLMVAIHEPLPAFFKQNVTTVVASVVASELGLKGNLTDVIVNITMLIHAVNGTEVPLTASACVVLSAPEDVFPRTRLVPTQCHGPQKLTQETKPVAPGSNVDPKGGSITAVASSHPCDNPSRIVTLYENDPALTVMLTQTEKDLVHVHLIYSSYFMFGMVAAVFIYGIACNRGTRLFSRLPSVVAKDSQPA